MYELKLIKEYRDGEGCNVRIYEMQQELSNNNKICLINADNRWLYKPRYGTFYWKYFVTFNEEELEVIRKELIMLNSPKKLKGGNNQNGKRRRR